MSKVVYSKHNHLGLHKPSMTRIDISRNMSVCPHRGQDTMRVISKVDYLRQGYPSCFFLEVYK